MTGEVISERSRSSRFFSHLQFRLLWLILFILLPAFALSLYTFSEQGTLAARSAQREALRLAQLVATEQNQLVESAEQLLIALVQLPEVRGGDTNACNMLFTTLREQYSRYTNLYMVDANGDTICSGLPTPLGFNVREQVWFQRAMQTRDFSVGDYALGALTRRPVITFSYPILDDENEITYQVGVSLDLEWLGSFITAINLPPGATVTAIDRTGIILYRYPADEDWIGQPWPDLAFAESVVFQGMGTAEGSGLSGGERLFGFASLDASNGSTYIIVGIPRAVAFAEANRLLIQNLLGLALVGIVTLIAALYGTELFVGRQVRVLMEGAERLASGDLAARVDLHIVESTHELRELAHVFNDMAGALEQREKEIIQAHDTLETKVKERTAELSFLVEAGAVLASSPDYEMTLATVTRLAVPRIGDWCVVNVVKEDGAVEQLAVAHVDPSKVEWVMELQQRYPPDPDSSSGIHHVIRTGQPEFYPDIPDELLVAAARNEQHLQLIRQLGLVSAMTVPLIAREHVLGTLSLATAESGRHYTEDELRLGEELARRVALAVDNARLFREAQEQRQHLQTTLASIGDAVIATNTEGCVTFMNRVAESLTGWTQADAEGKLLQDVFHIVNEATLEAVENPVAKVLREGVVVGLANHTILVSKDGRQLPIDDSGAPIRDDQNRIIGVVLVFRDVAERRYAEAQIREQNEIIETVNRVGQSVSAELDLHKLVQTVTDAATELSGAEFGAFFYNVLNDLGEFYTLYTISGAPREAFARFPMPRNTDLFGPTFRGEGVIRLDNVKKDSRYGKNRPHHGMPEGHLPVTSYLAVPVVSRSGEVLGGLFFGHPEEGVFKEREEQIVAGLAAQAAIAIDNARLYQNTHEQRILAEALRDTAVALNKSLELSDVLDQILTQTGKVVQHDYADVMFVEGDYVQIARSRGYVKHGIAESETDMQKLRLLIADCPNLQWIIENKQPFFIADVRTYDGWLDTPESRFARSHLGVPILIDGQVIGVLNLNSLTEGFFNAEHGERLKAFADQAAVAIKNARLHTQAQEAAALEERQRLARDLHDAVSQTLFSANVMAEALPRLWKRQPEMGLERLHQLSQLIRGASAEMRSLLLELRPTMVVNTPLAELLAQLTDAIKGRKKIDMTLDLGVKQATKLPPDVHIALYRIAQESLNNVVKHGQASGAMVELRSNAKRVEIKIKDNGRGFDPNEKSSGFGLTMMRERAQAVGAVLQIKSDVGQGTEVKVVWTARKAASAKS